MSHEPETVAPKIPLVVQLGFGGSRRLLDAAAHPGVDEAAFYAAVEEYLCGVLRGLPQVLGLSPEHFVCGVSQIAIGADAIFTRSCQRLGWRQRIFLPQHRDAYFEAADKTGRRDFTVAQAGVARGLLGSGHIIEDRLVSQSPERVERFEDVNLEIVRVSDVLVTLQRAHAEGRRGGTADLIRRAHARHRPLLEITVSVREGRPVFSEKWHPNKPPGVRHDAPLLRPPGIPRVMGECRIPQGHEYARVLKNFSSAQAKRHQWFFKWAALAIIGTHFVATILAVTGLTFREQECIHAAERWLLGCELALLVAGFISHLLLHHSHSAKQWAIARLISEVVRSVNAMHRVPGYLGHLFLLPLPELLRPLLRTLNVFHLEATRVLDPGTWGERRDAYVRHRLTHEKAGQISYYRREHGRASRRLRVADAAFYVSSFTAILTTALRLLLECHCSFLDWLEPCRGSFESGAGFLGMILPMLSVAALSLAASFDLDARRHTYGEMLAALEEQRRHIEAATSEREFAALVLQTEARIVGENVNWFSRRAFTGVT